MTDAVLKELAEFRIIGRLASKPELKTSNTEKQTRYCRPDIKVKAGKGGDRHWYMVCFGEVAEDFSLTTNQGDLVEVWGELQVQKNKVSDRWETGFIMRDFKLLIEAPENDEESVDKAYEEALASDESF